MGELDRVLGGGLVPGSVILLAGEPGIGKSTLLLAVAESVSRSGKVLYTSGEESQGQVRMRADRIGVTSESLYFAAEQDVDAILDLAVGMGPRLLIVDSIQTCEDGTVGSLPGGPTQVRACATRLQQYAKAENVTVVMVGHTVKAGGIAGPRLLEHLVDTVLYFEGDTNHLYRIVRAQKNRFGPTNEVSVFQMEEKGLIEVSNPSELFLSERNAGNIGSCVGACLKGNQAICLEIQALVATCVYGAPRRVTSEIEHGRAALILAVLSKRLGSGLDNRDAFLKVAGGIRIDEPGVDLACGIAVMSSYLEAPAKPSLACFGEIGLSGEVRMVARMEDRVKEATRIGFEQILVPVGFLKRHRAAANIMGVSSVEEAVRNALVQPASQ
jgi:DNA repair protein RadA/Sms